MKNAKELFKKLWKDESGQGATEYILLLVVVIAIGVMFKDSITGFIEDKLGVIGDKMGEFN